MRSANYWSPSRAHVKAALSCPVTDSGNQQLAQSVFINWLQPIIRTVNVNAAYWN